MSSVWGATDVASRDEGTVLCEMKSLEGKAEETEPNLDREDGDSLMCDKLYRNLDWRKGGVLRERS
jgi:hypothetical protein